MKAIVVGLGVQGKKRKKFLGKDFVFSVDKYAKADFKSISEVPLKTYDSVYLCTPDNAKLKIIDFCIKNKKNILVEKPMLAKQSKKLFDIEKKAITNKLLIQTAYNHRFEPAIVELKKIIKKKSIGKIYKCRMFYGNGTAFLVKKSPWRDKKLGIITDLGSHLIDICKFIFDDNIKKIKLLETNKFENKSADHATLTAEIRNIKVNLEMSYCMWKNTFNCDVLGSKGSIHINSLCKWSQSSLVVRKRVFPSGVPKEKKIIYKKGDPTWFLENKNFKDNIIYKKKTNLKKDIYINNCFKKLSKK